MTTQMVGFIALVGTVAGIVAVGVLVKVGLLDQGFADTAIGALLGGGAVAPVTHALGVSVSKPAA